MKSLHESEANFLAKVDDLWKEYESLPKIDLGRMGGNEPKEMKERFDQIRYIIAIRGMLRDGVREINQKYLVTAKDASGKLEQAAKEIGLI